MHSAIHCRSTINAARHTWLSCAARFLRPNCGLRPCPLPPLSQPLHSYIDLASLSIHHSLVHSLTHFFAITHIAPFLLFKRLLTRSCNHNGVRARASIGFLGEAGGECHLALFSAAIVPSLAGATPCTLTHGPYSMHAAQHNLSDLSGGPRPSSALAAWPPVLCCRRVYGSFIFSQLHANLLLRGKHPSRRLPSLGRRRPDLSCFPLWFV